MHQLREEVPARVGLIVMIKEFKRWVETIQLDSDMPDIEGQIMYEERFGQLIIKVSKRNNGEEKPRGEVKKDGNSSN